MYQLPQSENCSRRMKNSRQPISGPSMLPMPPMTTIKITSTVQSLTLKATSGEIRSFCRKISAPRSPVAPAQIT